MDSEYKIVEPLDKVSLFLSFFASLELTLMKRVPITPENETTTPVGRVELRVTRQKCIKNVGLRRLRA
uniref:Uncharacterized protein n=1 Tax=Candidatus Kentrum sp. UNK TaxID=2126344 RepID=A0A451B6E9_9GAMM|nr:MAG: hypothetical protein BECKUNK1418G_GA0071005_13451 [Candidatus Kentron sp. UNK]VFK73864.1 MAG: hypothetical protein BECKUNK1418H_GA0071006_13291 [Candidatus Kentron sp. UNK]